MLALFVPRRRVWVKATASDDGIALEYDLSNYYWMVRLLRTAPVSREMILNYVAEHSLGLPRSY